MGADLTVLTTGKSYWDGYTDHNLMWRFGWSYWQTLELSISIDDEGNLPVEGIKELKGKLLAKTGTTKEQRAETMRQLITAQSSGIGERHIDIPIETWPMEERINHFTDKLEEFISLLDDAINHHSAIEWSV